MYSDPIADMLTRIRNSYLARHGEVVMPHSKVKEAIAEVLKKYQYIANFKAEKRENNKKDLIVTLRYEQNKPSLTKIKRISKSGRQIYKGKNDLPYVLSGLGIAIISTSQGLMTAKEARRKKLGGEVICQVW